MLVHHSSYTYILVIKTSGLPGFFFILICSKEKDRTIWATPTW